MLPNKAQREEAQYDRVENIYPNDPAPIKTILDRFSLAQGVSDMDGATDHVVVHKPTKTFGFSDSVVRITEPDIGSDHIAIRAVRLFDFDSGATTSVNRELRALKKIQRALAAFEVTDTCPGYPGIFIRGSLTIGEVYYDEDTPQVFGPAMNRAVELEKITDYPVIVIDPRSIDLYRSLFTPSLEYGIVVKDDRLTKHRSEGFFVDYFTPDLLIPKQKNQMTPKPKNSTRPSPENGQFELLVACDQLEKMRIVLASRLNAHRNDDDDSVCRKYLWAAQRHNSAVKQVMQKYRNISAHADRLMVDI